MLENNLKTFTKINSMLEHKVIFKDLKLPILISAGHLNIDELRNTKNTQTAFINPIT